jgi:superfamily II DNA/RNA helicase
MNIFKFHDSVIADYRSYINSFIDIRDERIRQEVDRRLNDGKLWPPPLVQFNPAYEESAQIDDLISEGLLGPEMADVFSGYRLYRHQVEAIRLGVVDRDFVVTSGTGSGKSLTYLGTIFNHVLTQKVESGITAIIIYPMNALIESQVKEIDKYKKRYEEATGRNFPVRFAKYTGRDDQDARQKIIDEKPHILLTNYMMMELIMTRQREAGLRGTFQKNLRFLVYDELHTYRGRQGADVGMLNRRIAELAEHDLVCIGTSATMASGDDLLIEQRSQVARAAGQIFGKVLSTEQIIDEKLGRQFHNLPITPEQLSEAVMSPIKLDAPESALFEHPIAVWLEGTVGLEEREGELVRGTPLTLPEITRSLARDANLEENEELCRSALQNVLSWVEAVNLQRVENQQKPLLPFKLHQFIAQTGSVYVTLQDPTVRRVTLDAGYYLHDEASDSDTPIFPTVFSRLSGHEFVCVTRDDSANQLFPREFFDLERAVEDDDDHSARGGGYVIFDPPDDVLWSDELLDELPDSWVNRRVDGSVSLKRDHEDQIPQRIYFNADGKFSDAPGDFASSAWYMAAPMTFDPTAGTFYDRRTKEFTKLSQLGSEARSTATSVLSRSIVRKLGDAGVDRSAQKILSFTDNRQDASLQSGHFNDFVRVIHLRSAIYHALAEAKDNQLEIADLAQSVFAQMGLAESDYARIPIEASRFKLTNNDNEKALKDLIYYRALYDLRRGWRVVLPNLEQCGLLKICYKELADIVGQDESWKGIPGFEGMPPERRADVLQQILDYFRRGYALDHVNLEKSQIDHNENIIRNRLAHHWALDESEHLQQPTHFRVRPLQSRNFYTASIGYMSQLGRYLRNQPELAPLMSNRDGYDRFMDQLLSEVGSVFLTTLEHPVMNNGVAVQLYRLNVEKILWTLGDGENVAPDPVRLRSFRGMVAPRVNEFFRDVYRSPVKDVRMLTSAEHTAQIKSEVLKEREDKFREGALSTLFCSPTMELGVDIADLNVVHMRNVPPNPANYSQRSGRAGRSGQAALVVTYCANQSPHDRHYFQNSTDMVRGVVAPPTIDLANHELLRSHLHALYLGEVGLAELDKAIGDMVDINDPELLQLRSEVREKLQLPEAALKSIAERFESSIMGDLSGSISASWYTPEWTRNTLNRVPQAFDEALNRWRQLYRSALLQLNQAQRMLDDVTYKKDHKERKEAERREKQARRQRDLLLNDIRGRSQSEFYPYRYLAAEGFLPGYNFTRLPVRAFLPVGDQGEFISRPRPIALQEFGPYNQIYHNGAKYEVNRQQIADFDNYLTKARVSLQSGYFLKDGQYDFSHCPFTGAPIHGDGNGQILPRLIEMDEVQARAVESISCEEEERSRRGFDIDTYFAADTDLSDVRTLSLRRDDMELLTVKYIPAARLYFVNNGWRFYREKEFVIEKKTGVWKKSPRITQTDEDKVLNPVEHVRLYTTDTADALYLHPSATLGLTTSGILTLQFALKKAIEHMFNVEPGEIAGVLMGVTDQPNIMIYESSQGSLGVLSQIVDNPAMFRSVVVEAYKVCYFDRDPEEERTKPRASYDDLLSYYNQRHHAEIDRHLIKGALQTLMACDPEAQGNKRESYEDHYQRILGGLDPNSALELQFLNHLYEHGIRLPDQAQYRAANLYVQPDFFYRPNVVVFVDGSVHNKPDVQEGDLRKRRALRNDSFRVIEYSYRDDLAQIIERNADIFSRVK